MSTKTKKSIPRFTPGKLLMISKKQKKFTEMKCFVDNSQGDCDVSMAYRYQYSGWTTRNQSSIFYKEKYALSLQKGLPFVLVKEPELVYKNDKKYFEVRDGWCSKYNGNTKFGKVYRITLIYKDKILISYLTKKEFSQYLCLAVERRLDKQYG